MVGAVNRVPPVALVQRSAAASRNPASVARAQDGAATDAASDILHRARTGEMEALLASLASAPSGAHVQAAQILQAAEQKLTRLKAEARAAAVSGDRRAARSIARDLAVVAREIADAAQDYAVAQAQPDIVSPALAKATARMNGATVPGAGDAVDAGALVAEAPRAAAEAAQAAANAGAPASASPEATGAEGESRQVGRAVNPERTRGGSSPTGSRGAQDDDILVEAHRLFEEAVDLLHAMETLAGERTALAGHAGRGVAPVWPLVSVGVSTGAP